ncbi:hypothetical protein [Kordia sp.]|uniref:hypothetical protein n=1 Tax=Kordia sp. TaxID=1965332 RepID=UPI003D2B0480
MRQILGNLIFTGIGFIYLCIRHRNREKVAEAKKEEYEDRYAVAGMKFVLSVIGIIFMTFLVIALLGTIYIIITRPPAAT